MLTNKDTILMDLDGTLLPLDIEDFVNKYFHLLTREFTDLGEPEYLIDCLMKATGRMIENDGRLTNEDVFINSFFSLIEVDDTDAIMDRFTRFYREKFPLLKNEFNFDNRAVELVEILNKLGFKMAVATNPLFPREAIIQRIKWAGLDPADFCCITSYENMHYSKPNLNYYRELLARINVPPERCIMIGNDNKEDIIAGKLGITTFLVKDYEVNNDGECSPEPDWKGSFSGLVSFFAGYLYDDVTG